MTLVWLQNHGRSDIVNLVQLCAFSGSGKTHTLIGNISSTVNKGLVPRAAQQLCQAVKEPPSGCSLQLSMTVVEIYCERIRDLLIDGSQSADLSITQVCESDQSVAHAAASILDPCRHCTVLH